MANAVVLLFIPIFPFMATCNLTVSNDLMKLLLHKVLKVMEVLWHQVLCPWT